MNDKPVFIPLKKQYFDEFDSNKKDTEYRLYGAKWNEHVCKVGRKVVLSCGYGKHKRLEGVITHFDKKPVLRSKGGAVFSLVYGMTAGYVAEIRIWIIR